MRYTHDECKIKAVNVQIFKLLQLDTNLVIWLTIFWTSARYWTIIIIILFILYISIRVKIIDILIIRIFECVEAW